MSYYSKNVIQRIKQIDLLTYLKNYEPEELIHYSKDTYMTKTHDSLKISNGMWYWFSRGVGGKSALEYLIKVKDYSFIEAVEILVNCLDEKGPLIYKSYEKQKDIKLILPEKNDSNDKVIIYLMSRGIDEDIIKECIDNDLIYQQSKSNNVVFVGYDKTKTARYAGVRATNNSRFMQDAYGSHKAFSFRLESSKENNSVHLFESAIDLLSYATLLKINNKEWFNENLLSLAGVYQPAKNIEDSKVPLALNYYLNQHPEIKRIYLHLDNDYAGRLATKALKETLPKKYEVIDIPPLIGKDFNDYLCYKVGKNYNKRYELGR